MKPLNILYLNSHDTGRCIQPLGFPVAMPNLTRFASQGILFRNNFCVAPTCSPSRAALVTGCYPHENGMLGLAHRGFRLNDYRQHWIHALHAAGYTSVLAGAQHIARQPDWSSDWRTIGYHRDVPGDKYTADDRLISVLENPPAQPFYLESGFTETHREFPALATLANDPQFDPDHTAPLPPLPDTPGVRQDVARYMASARTLDRKWGRVFDALDRTGLSANTLVICTTDHGIAFPRMKCNLQDTGTGTFLIIRGPQSFAGGAGAFTGGKVIDAMTTHLDLFPTVCEVLGIAPPAWLRGKSLLPLVRGETARLHEAVFGEINFHAVAEPVRCVRTDRWKYIRRYDGRTTPVLPNCDDGESKTAWLEAGWATRPFATEQLYDLAFDPVETDNRAADPACAEVLQDMRGRLERWMRETNDPLTKGPLIPPKGAILNDANGRSPQEPTLPPVA
ncbi:MAG TPA: sulfatase [Planctomycetota bacterium]|nr:sulfatase [Planctomycetota bacterium]